MLIVVRYIISVNNAGNKTYKASRESVGSSITNILPKIKPIKTIHPTGKTADITETKISIMLEKFISQSLQKVIFKIFLDSISIYCE